MRLLVGGVPLGRVNLEQKDHLLTIESPTGAVLHQERNIQVVPSLPSMQGHPLLLLNLLLPGRNVYEELKLEECLRENMEGSMVGGSIGIYRKVVQREMLGVIERRNLQDQGMVLLHQIDTAGLNMLVIQEMWRK